MQLYNEQYGIILSLNPVRREHHNKMKGQEVGGENTAILHHRGINSLIPRGDLG